MLDDFENRTQPTLSSDASPTRCKSSLQQRGAARRSSTSSVRRRSRAWARPAASRSSSRTPATTACPPCSKTADQVVADGDADPQLARPVHQLPRRHAVAGARHRPRPGQGPRRLDRRRPHDAGIDPRLVLHQRLQPLRPHLAGQRAGRRIVPPDGRGRQAAQGPQQPRARWCRWPTSPRCAHVSGPVMVMRYNMYPSAADQRRRRAGHQLRPGDRPHWKTSANDELPQIDADRVDRAGAACNCRPATRPCGSSCWRWCWCSWCWRRSTKAGRCRWRSFWSCRCACCARSPAWSLARMDINIFTQIGFVVLVGLACKNAILIVEFAKAQREAGAPRYEATLDACQLRLRPIIMTSFAFILGVVPLMLSRGRRRRNAPHAGHGRLRRHARRDAVRHLPDAGVLLRHPVVHRPAAGQLLRTTSTTSPCFRGTIALYRQRTVSTDMRRGRFPPWTKSRRCSRPSERRRAYRATQCAGASAKGHAELAGRALVQVSRTAFLPSPPRERGRG